MACQCCCGSQRELSRGPLDTSAVVLDSEHRSKCASECALATACARGNATIVEVMGSLFLEHSTTEEGSSAADAAEPVTSWPATRIGPWQRTEVLSPALNTAPTHDHPQLVKRCRAWTLTPAQSCVWGSRDVARHPSLSRPGTATRLLCVSCWCWCLKTMCWRGTQRQASPSSTQSRATTLVGECAVAGGWSRVDS